MISRRSTVLVLLCLLLASVASASVQYPLESVDVEDKITIPAVVDTRFMAANNNIIKTVDVDFVRGYGVNVVNLSSQDYVISYTVTKTSVSIGYVDLEHSLKMYEGGALVYNESQTTHSSKFLLDSKAHIRIKNGFVNIPGPPVNLTPESTLLPAPEVTVSTSTSASVKLLVVNMAEVQRSSMKDDLNPLFSVMYWFITISPFYSDSEGGLLSFMYVFSISMDVILWIIWLSISSTASVFAYIEGAIVFYAGWRNNKLKGFVDNLVQYHLAIFQVTVVSIKELFIQVYGFIKSIVPGIGD